MGFGKYILGAVGAAGAVIAAPVLLPTMAVSSATAAAAGAVAGVAVGSMSDKKKDNANKISVGIEEAIANTCDVITIDEIDDTNKKAADAYEEGRKRGRMEAKLEGKIEECKNTVHDGNF